MPHDLAFLRPLSRREIEMLQQIARGIPNREIAAAFDDQEPHYTGLLRSSERIKVGI